MPKTVKLLIIEDQEGDAELIREELERQGFIPTLRRVDTPEMLRDALGHESWDAVLSDYSMPSFDAPRALRIVREVDPDIPFVIVSGSVGDDVAVEAVKAGAQDYVLKENLTRLGGVLDRELREGPVRRQHRREAARRRILAEASALLGTSLDHAATLEGVARLAVPSLADWCVIDLEEDSGIIRTTAVHVDSQKSEWAKKNLLGPLPAAVAAARAPLIRNAEPLLFASITEEGLWALGQDERHVAFLRELGARSGLILSMRGRERRVGSMVLVTGPDRPPFTPEDAALAEALAERAGLAIDSARLHQALQDAKVTLERRVQERTQDLDAFTYSVAHDIQAPLRFIVSYSQILLDDFSQNLPAQAREHLNRIIASARSLSQLTSDLLSYSHASRSEIKLEGLDLRAILQRVLSSFEPEIKSREAVVRIEGPSPRVRGNELGLQLALGNLIANGLKFVPAGKHPEVTVRIEPTDGLVRLWVEDNGIGISRDEQHALFRPFVRLMSRATYPGTGLGLAIVRRAIERMGGSVGLVSASGEGSRFWIELLKE